MKIKATDSCYGININIDGKIFNDLSLEDKKNFFKSLIDKIENLSDYEVFDYLCQLTKEEDFKIDQCDQCGHSIIDINLNL